MGTASSTNDSELPSIRELEDQLMCLRIREADASVELREVRQKLMELEAHNHVCSNQLKRQDDEIRRLREDKEVLAKVTAVYFLNSMLFCFRPKGRYPIC